MTSSPSNVRRQPSALSPRNLTRLAQPQAWGLSLCGGLTVSLFLARFYYVAESADRGETLGLVGLWFLALTVWLVASWKSSTPWIPVGWADLAVVLLAGGQVVSSLRIVATVGDKRAAVNLAWEWVGIAVCWFLMRQQSRDQTFRRLIAAGLIATGGAIAGLGLYQHYVEFPGMAAKYGAMFDRLRQADPVEAASLRQKLAKDNIPVDGPGSILFEKRLRDSREPLGFFALANTLGGFLAVCVIVAVAITLTSRSAQRHLIPLFSLLAIVGWCLLLTKSRTAWVGTAVGLVALWFGWREAKRAAGQFRVIAFSLIGLIVLSWGLSQLGGLDSQVLTEAPKSLQYRLQYWVATSRMIRDHFLFGVGPGQFRLQYLYYKLPEASEEIADPHNLFFDVAANGGLVSLAGLVFVCGLLLLQLKPVAQESAVHAVTPAQDDVRAATLISVIAALSWACLLVTGSDDRLLIVLPVAVGLFWWVGRLLATYPGQEGAVRVGMAAAAVTLIVHLCGAGGIGMPAVSTLLLTLIGCPGGIREQDQDPARSISGLAIGWGLALAGILAGTWYVTGMRPVALVQERMSAGDRHVERGQRQLADSEYSSAAQADEWASEPWRRRAELAYREAVSEQSRSNESFQIAVDLLHQAKRRDPNGFRDDLQLGEWWRTRWRKTSDVHDIQEAVKAFSTAYGRYPTNAILMGDLALSLVDAEDRQSGQQMAEKALRQDHINQEWGHVDRFLEPGIRTRLTSLVENQGQPEPQDAR